jgi:magnesium transporter
MPLLRLFHRRFTEQGAAPGTLLTTQNARPIMSAIAYDGADLKEAEINDIASARALAGPDQKLWIDVQGPPDARLLEEAGAAFGLHPLALADVVNVGQRPKIEDYEDHLFAVVRMVSPDETGFRWEQVSLFIGRGFVLSFQEHPGDCFEPVRQRLRAGRRRIRGNPADYLGAMLVDAVVDGYFPLLEDYGERLEDLETRVLRQPTHAVLSEVYHAKRELMTFRRAVWPLRDTLNQLLRDGHTVLKKSTLPYLRDTVDHLMQVVDVVETFRELAGSFIDVYLSSVSHRTNEVMRVLTIFATIFIPLTFVAGIYGMNFEVIPELKWRHGYFMFWGVVVVILAGMLLLFRRLGWLRRPDNLYDDK